MLVSTLMHKDWYAWIGKKVYVNKDVGTLRYFGEIKSKIGVWCGIEFEEPIGVTDGKMSGIQYFKCQPYFGIFVPMHEVNRSKSNELTHHFDKTKIKGCELSNAATRTRPKKSLGSIKQNFDTNKSRPGSATGTVTKAEKKQPDANENVSVRKKSKNSSRRFGTDESLGILSNLLEDGSWDELASNEKENDSVFSPPIQTVLPSLKPDICETQFNKHVPFLKVTSTPKPSFKNVFDLGATVKLEDLQLDQSFHDEIEPIIAGSNAIKSMDFDLTNFKQGEILCSTSKLTLPLLPNASPVLKEMPCIENKELGCNESIKDLILSINDGNKVSGNVSFTEVVPKTKKVLNATFEINPEQLTNHTEYNQQDAIENGASQPTAANSIRKSNGTVDLNATFVFGADSPAREANKTFVLDHSPVKPLGKSSSVESELNFEKKSLSVILEGTMSESLCVNDFECVDTAQTTSNPQEPDSNKNNCTLIVTPAGKEEIVPDLNSTFCIAVKEVKSEKNNTVIKNINKRYSLSSISEKTNIPLQQRKSVILGNKFYQHPQPLNNQKTIQVPAPYGATMKTRVIKNSSITIANKKDEVKSKIVSEDTSRLSSKNNMKIKSTVSTSRVTDQPKRISNSYKSVSREPKQKENEVHVTVKITENNTHIVERRKSVGGMVTKVTSKISYGSNRKSISENSSINLKVNNEAKIMNGFKSTNLSNTKHKIVNRRHTMLPTISSSIMQAKAGVTKSKSDVSDYRKTKDETSSSLRDDKYLHSANYQDSSGSKKELLRDNVIKKPVKVESPQLHKSNQKDISSKLDNKQNEKSSVPRRELLKPGMLSRLPIAAKSIKKPGFLATGTKPIKTKK